jgi:hypothetical protein
MYAGIAAIIYATLYYAIHDSSYLPKHLVVLMPFDDMFGIWDWSHRRVPGAPTIVLYERRTTQMFANSPAFLLVHPGSQHTTLMK